MKCDKCGTIVSNGIEDGEGHKTCEACWRREGETMRATVARCMDCEEKLQGFEPYAMTPDGAHMLCQGCDDKRNAVKTCPRCHNGYPHSEFGRYSADGQMVCKACHDAVLAQHLGRPTNPTLKISGKPVTAENVWITSSHAIQITPDTASTGIGAISGGVEPSYIVEGQEVTAEEYAAHVTKEVNDLRRLLQIREHELSDKCLECKRVAPGEQGAGIAKTPGVGRSMVLPVDVDYD